MFSNILFMPRHEIWHMVSPLSVCARVFVNVIPESCPIHNFVLRCGFSKLFSPNAYHDKTMYRAKTNMSPA